MPVPVCDPVCIRMLVMGTLHCITFLGLVCVLGVCALCYASQCLCLWSGTARPSSHSVILVQRIILFEKRVNYRLFIFSLAAVQTLLGWIHYFAAHNTPIMTYVMYALEIGMYTLICYYFCSLACYLFQREELVKRVLNPAFVAISAYLVIVLVVTAVRINVNDSTAHCRDAFWLLLSISGFILTSMFLGAAVLISRKLSHYVVVSRSLREERTHILRVLLIVNFISTLVGFCYDVGMEFDASVTGDSRCNDWTGAEAADALIYLTIRVSIQLLPIWAALWVLFVKPLMGQRAGGGFKPAFSGPPTATVGYSGSEPTGPLLSPARSRPSLADGGHGSQGQGQGHHSSLHQNRPYSQPHVPPPNLDSDGAGVGTLHGAPTNESGYNRIVDGGL